MKQNGANHNILAMIAPLTFTIVTALQGAAIWRITVIDTYHIQPIIICNNLPNHTQVHYCYHYIFYSGDLGLAQNQQA